MAQSVEELVLIELRRIIRTTQLNAKLLARDTGMTPSQRVALQLLQASGEMTARQIAQSLHLTQATVTALLDRLQERGWIVRRRDTSDRRRVYVKLTATADQELRRAPETLHERFLRDFRALQPWEQSSILAALQRVGQLMDAAAMDPSPVLDVGTIERSVDSD